MKKNRNVVKVFVMIISLLVSLSAEFFYFDDSIAYAATTGTVTASMLNVRSGAGTRYSIKKSGSSLVRLSKGTTVIINSEKSGWYNISFTYAGKSMSGYVSKSYVKKGTALASTSNSTSTNTVTSITGTRATVTASSLNVRSGPSTSYGIMRKNGSYVRLRKGVVVGVTGTSGSWSKITFAFAGSFLTGYVASEYINTTTSTTANTTTIAPQTKAGTTTADVLNVRTGASTSYSILKSNGSYVKLKKGTAVNINLTSGSWYNVTFSYNGVTLTGYVSSAYVTTSSAPVATPTPTVAPTPVPVVTAAPATLAPSSVVLTDITASGANRGRVIADTSLNVRTGAGTSYEILKYNNMYIRLAYNTIVNIDSEQSGWHGISFVYNNETLTGYVSAVYIEKIVATTQPTTAPVEPTQAPVINDTTQVEQPAATTIYETGNVTASVLNVRTGVGTTNSILLQNNDKVKLTTGTSVKILETINDWYRVSFTYNNETLEGYVCGQYIQKNTSGQSDAEFEAKLTQQGFPESYKVLLRQIHAKHPKWEFQAYNTGLDWDTVIAKEGIVGLNLIPSSKNTAWKSQDTGAYNWATDTYIGYDTSAWVSASKSVVAYYMDPRNFLYDTTIFQFELLSYQNAYQTQSGIEGILKNTLMYNAQAPYVDTTDSTLKTMLYSEIFMKAAEYSGVSPYHLASRVKQEVVTGTNSMSGSVSGTYSGYEGYYNYYNIGATHSTATSSAVANGLNYAKNGTSSASTNESYMIPWTDAYRAIVGGSKFIGASYINRGQNTIYLEKFNVTAKSTYYHQYMSNVQAAWSESVKVASAYQELENYNELPIVFSIPVYNNMPDTACSLPADTKNPNNWLKTLSISGYSLTPTFDVSKNQEYSIVVDNNINSINIAATAASSLASISGTGDVALIEGNNKVNITVTAQNGDVRMYVLNVIRQ